MNRARAAAIVVSLVMCLAAAAAAEVPVAVPFDELRQAMAQSRGYNLLATTNGARLQAEVLLRLAGSAMAKRPDGPPLLIRHDDWFRALLAVAAVPAERAPTYAQLAWRHGQDVVAEYRADRMIREVVRGPRPLRALDITISWPESAGAPSSYSYEDKLSTPHLKVTNKRLITYRLLDFGDMIALDEIDGLTGRPTSGALGLLFQLIGEGRILEYRMAVAPNGVQVARGRARKAFFEVASTVTVQPDGRSEKGVPPDPALRALEERISRPFEIRYAPRR